jgi:hypothetical protein
MEIIKIKNKIEKIIKKEKKKMDVAIGVVDD